MICIRYAFDKKYVMPVEYVRFEQTCDMDVLEA